jgi:hypothetical protein
MNLGTSLLDPINNKQVNPWRKAYAAVSFSALALSAIYLCSSNEELVQRPVNEQMFLHELNTTTSSSSFETDNSNDVNRPAGSIEIVLSKQFTSQSSTYKNPHTNWTQPAN